MVGAEANVPKAVPAPLDLEGVLIVNVVPAPLAVDGATVVVAAPDPLVLEDDTADRLAGGTGNSSFLLLRAIPRASIGRGTAFPWFRGFFDEAVRGFNSGSLVSLGVVRILGIFGTLTES